MSITRTSLIHPTMIKKIRAALYYANKGMGHMMNGHNKRCYIQNAKGHNIMRLNWVGGPQGYIVWGSESRDITKIVKSALASVVVRELMRQEAKAESFALAYSGKPQSTSKPNILLSCMIAFLGLSTGSGTAVWGVVSGLLT